MSAVSWHWSQSTNSRPGSPPTTVRETELYWADPAFGLTTFEVKFNHKHKNIWWLNVCIKSIICKIFVSSGCFGTPCSFSRNVVFHNITHYLLWPVYLLYYGVYSPTESYWTLTEKRINTATNKNKSHNGYLYVHIFTEKSHFCINKIESHFTMKQYDTDKHSRRILRAQEYFLFLQPLVSRRWLVSPTVRPFVSGRNR